MTPHPESPSTERVIARRWEEWLPFASLRAAAIACAGIEISTLMNLYRDTHRRRMLQLLAAGINLSIVERDLLDDPLESEANAQARIQRAIALRVRSARRSKYDARYRRKDRRE